MNPMANNKKAVKRSGRGPWQNGYSRMERISTRLRKTKKFKDGGKNSYS